MLKKDMNKNYTMELGIGDLAMLCEQKPRYLCGRALIQAVCNQDKFGFYGAFIGDNRCSIWGLGKQVIFNTTRGGLIESGLVIYNNGKQTKF